MLRKVQVVPHNPNWAEQFQSAAQEITAVLGPQVVAIHHIGSTAIPGISAKPIIDLLVEARDIGAVDGFNEEMVALGYQPKGENGIPGRRFFLKGTEERRSQHIHIFQTGNPAVERHLRFRDYLIAHPEEARAYSCLKEELARRFPEDIDSYMAGKGGFIKDVDKRTRVV